MVLTPEQFTVLDAMVDYASQESTGGWCRMLTLDDSGLAVVEELKTAYLARVTADGMKYQITTIGKSVMDREMRRKYARYITYVYLPRADAELIDEHYRSANEAARVGYELLVAHLRKTGEKP